MYSFQSRIRYSEIGQDGMLKTGSLVDYFQDCSTFHSESIGLGIEFWKKENKAWVLSSWQIMIERMPTLGEEVTISTWPYDFQGFLGRRNFLLQDAEGRRLAYANSLWIYMDMNKQRPTKVSDVQMEGYQLEEKLDMDYASRKIEIKGLGEKQNPIIVSLQQIDTNHHMNNSHYIRLAEEHVPAEFAIGQIRVEYKKAAVSQDVMVPVRYETDNGYMVVLQDEAEHPYAIVELTKA